MNAHPQPLPPHLATLVASTIPRLASEHDGEVVATARAIGLMLRSAGLDFHDLAKIVTGAVATDEEAMTVDCLNQRDLFNARECRFLENARDLIGGGHELTAKQVKWLRDLHRIAVTKWDRSERAA